MTSTSFRTFVLSAAIGSGCASEQDSVVEVGWIERAGELARIEAPTEAKTGDGIMVRVSTIGGGCISLASTETEVIGDEAHFTPFDRRVIPGENEACTSELRYLPHEATFTFDGPGMKVVHIHGRRLTGSTEELIDQPLSIEIH